MEGWKEESQEKRKGGGKANHVSSRKMFPLPHSKETPLGDGCAGVLGVDSGELGFFILLANGSEKT